MSPRPAALIVSLDFELLWGVRDVCSRRDPYCANLLGARQAVPRLLDLFQAFKVGATWAVVGLLWASSDVEQRRFWPDLRPTYRDARLDPYQEMVGRSEVDDPLLLGRTLIEQIRATPGQELASHSFSHFYCQEVGQTLAQFRADLEAAGRVAQDWGAPLRSLVFPRNQVNPAYLEVLREQGLTGYRGLEAAWTYRPLAPWLVRWQRPWRWLDSFLNLTGDNRVAWKEIDGSGPPYNLRGSRFLRPATGQGALDRLQVRRIRQSLEATARRGGTYHLWWHPHNFGARTEENLSMLEQILQHFDRLRSQGVMTSLTMQEAATLAR